MIRRLVDIDHGTGSHAYAVLGFEPTPVVHQWWLYVEYEPSGDRCQIPLTEKQMREAAAELIRIADEMANKKCRGQWMALDGGEPIVPGTKDTPSR